MSAPWRIVVGLAVCLCVTGPAWAEEASGEALGGAAEAADAMTAPETSQPGFSEQDVAALRDRINRETDADLRELMEQELDQLVAGNSDLRLSDVEGSRLAPDALLLPDGRPAEGLFLGPPAEGGTGGTMAHDPAFEAVQSDPRMQELRAGFEAGALNEGQAREQMFEILRDHGIEPDQGREWQRSESETGAGNYREGSSEAMHEGSQGDSHDAFERLFEGHASETMTFREYDSEGPSERDLMMRDAGLESSRDLSMPEREMATPEFDHEMTSSEREMATPEFEREMATTEIERELAMPEIEREMAMPEIEREMEFSGPEPSREFEAPEVEHEMSTEMEHDGPEMPEPPSMP